MITAERGAPIDLIDLACGSTHYRYNSTTGNVTDGGNVYYAQAGFLCGEIEIARNVLRSQFEVTLPWSCTFCQQFVSGAPEDIVTITNYRGQWSAPWDCQYERWWAGFVKEVRFDSAHRAVVACVSALSDIGSSGLALKCGRLCQVPLYSSSCGVTKASYRFGGIVTAVSGYTVTADLFATEDDGYWVGGTITARDATRLIIAHSDYTVTLSDSIANLAVNDAFVAYAGCDRTFAICDSRFSNTANFRGQPHIPDLTPNLQGVTT